MVTNLLPLLTLYCCLSSSSVSSAFSSITKQQWKLHQSSLFMTIHNNETEVAPVEEAAFNRIRGSAVTLSPSSFDFDSSKTVVYGIRHGRSVSNDWMRGANAWGSPTYNDAHNTPDAPLSVTGIQQAQDLAAKLHQERLLAGGTRHWLDQIELIVVSPLTRCLQTYHWAVHPVLTSSGKTPLIMAHPLLSERVYTVSETGRPVGQLQAEFPYIDWSCFHCGDEDAVDRAIASERRSNHDRWWYDPSVPTAFNTFSSSDDTDQSLAPWEEWRPSGQGQVYLAAGEPEEVFQRRMAALQHWLKARPERHILTVAHWGVYRHLTGGMELGNCQVCSVEL